MKRYVILVSHGELAGGMHSVLDMFAGKNDEVLSTSLKNGMSSEEFKRCFEDLIAPIVPSDEIILFGDIMGGSPLTLSMEILVETGLFDNAVVFTGMNVCTCLTAVLTKDSIKDENLFVSNVLAEGKSGIARFEMSSCEDCDEL